jgi:hypothetical protein
MDSNQKTMNKTIDELIEQSGFSKTYEKERLEQLVKLTVDSCIDAVNQTDRRHAFTTYDMSMIVSTIEKSVRSIKQKFE